MSLLQDITTRRTQWVLLSFVLASFAVLVAASLVHERNRIVREQEQRLITKARVIDENVQRQLQGVSNALLSVIHDFHKLKNDQDFLLLRLKALTDAMPGVRTINVLDGSGRVLASNRENVIGIYLSQREYFQTAVQRADPDALYLSEPFKTVLGVYSLNLVKVIVDPEGAVTHVITATLEPEFFQVLLSSVRFADDVWVALAHSNGRLVLHYPDRPDLLGFDLRKPGSFFSRHVESGQPSTFLTGQVVTTGEMAWMAQRTITAPELNMRGSMVIAVARSADQALEHWRLMAAIGAAIVVLVSCLSVFALWRWNLAQDKMHAVLAHEEELRREAEQEIRQMAFHDHLTQLPNRRLLFDRLGQLMAASIRHGRHSALCFLDLDDFKRLNDQYGHDKGDRLLQEVARRLQAAIRQEDTVARWAGDEFVIMLSELGGDAEEAGRRAGVVAEKILTSLSRDYDLDGLTYRCTASMGVTLFGRQDEPVDDIIKRADQAMYEAKATGRNTYRNARQA